MSRFDRTYEELKPVVLFEDGGMMYEGFDRTYEELKLDFSNGMGVRGKKF